MTSFPELALLPDSPRLTKAKKIQQQDSGQEVDISDASRKYGVLLKQAASGVTARVSARRELRPRRLSSS